LPTRFERTSTTFGLTSGTQGAWSTVCLSMRSHSPRAASGFVACSVKACSICRSMRGSQNSATFRFAGSLGRNEAQLRIGMKKPEGADDIAATIRGTEPPAPYEGSGVCYAEFGGGLVSKVEVNFLRGEAPAAERHEPSLEYAAEKKEFGKIRRVRWFGRS
jgi:hypothetical protein